MNDFAELEADISESIVSTINWMRDRYVFANENPEEYVTRAAAIKAYSKAISDLKRTRISFANLPIKSRFNLECSRRFHDMDKNFDFHSNILSRIQHAEKIVEKLLEDNNLNRLRIIDAPPRENSKPQLRYFLYLAHRQYELSGKKVTVTFGEYESDYFKFLNICFDGIPNKFHPGKQSLGDRAKRMRRKIIEIDEEWKLRDQQLEENSRKFSALFGNDSDWNCFKN